MRLDKMVSAKMKSQIVFAANLLGILALLGFISGTLNSINIVGFTGGFMLGAVLLYGAYLSWKKDPAVSGFKSTDRNIILIVNGLAGISLLGFGGGFISMNILGMSLGTILGIALVYTTYLMYTKSGIKL